MKREAAGVLIVLAATLGGCASVAPGNAPTAGQKTDPWENWNRKVYAFNDAIDTAVVKPVAETYRKVLPPLLRTGIGNVLGNVGDVWSTANQFLQGKLQLGFEMGMRVLTNTVFGLGGLLDPASEMGLMRRSEDFGQTLGRWGVAAGPFVMLPLLGPSTLRDTAALPVDRMAAPGSLPSDPGVRYAVTGLELIDARSNLLSTTTLVDQVALDRYSFIRDAYLARRADQVYDGAAPLENFNDEPADDAAEPSPKRAAPSAAAAPASAASAAAPPK